MRGHEALDALARDGVAIRLLHGVAMRIDRALNAAPVCVIADIKRCSALIPHARAGLALAPSALPRYHRTWDEAFELIRIAATAFAAYVEDIRRDAERFFACICHPRPRPRAVIFADVRRIIAIAFTPSAPIGRRAIGRRLTSASLMLLDTSVSAATRIAAMSANAVHTDVIAVAEKPIFARDVRERNGLAFAR